MVAGEGVEGSGEIAEVLENDEKTLGMWVGDEARGEVELFKVGTLAAEAAGAEAHCVGGGGGEGGWEGDFVRDGGFVVFWI